MRSTNVTTARRSFLSLSLLVIFHAFQREATGHPNESAEGGKKKEKKKEKEKNKEIKIRLSRRKKLSEFIPDGGRYLQYPGGGDRNRATGK